MDKDELKFLYEVVDVFKVEAKSHLKLIADNVLKIESGKIDETDMDATFRAAHSLKGSAGTVGFDRITEIAHAIEELLGIIRRSKISPDKAVIDSLLYATDFLVSQIDILDIENDIESSLAETTLTLLKNAQQLEIKDIPHDKRRATNRDETQIAAPEDEYLLQEIYGVLTNDNLDESSVISSSPISDTSGYIMVQATKLEEIEANLRELDAIKARGDGIFAELQNIMSTLGKIDTNFENSFLQLSTSSDVSESIDVLRKHQSKIYSLTSELRKFEFSYSVMKSKQSLIVEQFNYDVQRLRMYPIKDMFEKFRRTIRDISSKSNKKVDFIIEGEDNELDKRIIEEVKDPINHLLRNSVDHGIEEVEERIKQGKPEYGTVALKASRNGPNLAIEISDDGRGLNNKAIIEQAIEKGELTRERADTLTTDEIYSTIFRPGFSTKQDVSQISGRGVGLDVVRQNINNLGGQILVQSQPDVGTAVTLLLPLTIATNRGLLIREGESHFLIPGASINWVDNVVEDDVFSVQGREVFLHQTKSIPLIELAKIVGSDTPKRDKEQHVTLVLTGKQGEVGIVVDEILGEQEFVMRGLGKILKKVPFYSGATITGKGEVVLVLNAEYIANAAFQTRTERKQPRTQKAFTKKKGRILIVDDSITTRTLEKNILESAGYNVVTASDGVEGYDAAMDENISLAIIDVQMPRMNGFELTRKLRDTEKTLNLPIILVTSLDSDDHKREGVEAGADAYMTKQEFNQNTLLELLEQFL